jgi:pyruvate/2-oxoglutarate dehydrogenase complex dihydrolipoamide dehydrogenase (E3) component
MEGHKPLHTEYRFSYRRTPHDHPRYEPDGEKILDYEDAILLQQLPKSAVIIGGGAVGVEFATVWSAYGVEVHIVEMLPHILLAKTMRQQPSLVKLSGNAA